jgi:hypothetical protein
MRRVQVDKTFLAAALRETQEEVGILPDRVEILGQVGPPQLSLSGLRVWPYVVRLSVTAACINPFICCDVANVIPVGFRTRHASASIRNRWRSGSSATSIADGFFDTVSVRGGGCISSSPRPCCEPYTTTGAPLPWCAAILGS